MAAWLAKPRCVPSQHCADARAYSLKTTAMHDNMSTPCPPFSLHRRELAYKAPPATNNANPTGGGGGRSGRERGQLGLATIAPMSLTEGTVQNDSSSSSDEDQLYGVNRISRQCVRTGGRKLISVVSGPSQNVEVEVRWVPSISYSIPSNFPQVLRVFFTAKRVLVLCCVGLCYVVLSAFECENEGAVYYRNS